MVGNNTIELNPATMALAVQHYFDTVLFAQDHSPKVESVRGGNNIGGMFTVEVSDPKTRQTG